MCHSCMCLVGGALELCLMWLSPMGVASVRPMFFGGPPGGRDVPRLSPSLSPRAKRKAERVAATADRLARVLAGVLLLLLFLDRRIRQ